MNASHSIVSVIFYTNSVLMPTVLPILVTFFRQSMEIPVGNCGECFKSLADESGEKDLKVMNNKYDTHNMEFIFNYNLCFMFFLD